MNAYSRANAAYGAAARTVSPISAIVMLFDGALKQLRTAHEEDVAKRPIERYQAIDKAMTILQAMHATLDFEEAGEIAPSLDRFYRVVCAQLVVLGSQREAGPRLLRVIDQIREMRNAWAVRGGLSGATETTPAPAPAAAARQPLSMSAA